MRNTSSNTNGGQMTREEVIEHAARTDTYPVPFVDIVRESERAVCLDVGWLVWLPKSQIEMAACDQDCPADSVVFVPQWLARKKRLLACQQ